MSASPHSARGTSVLASERATDRRTIDRVLALQPRLPPGVTPTGAVRGDAPLDRAVRERCDVAGEGPGYTLYRVR